MLTTRETAERLGLSVSTVRRMARAGALKPLRLTQGSHLRFASSAVDAIAGGETMGVRREGGWWFCQFECRDPVTGETVRVHRKSVDNTRRSAEILERTIRAQIAAGTWGQAAPSTLAAFAKDYVRHLRVSGRKAAYIADAETVLRMHLIPHLGRVTLGSVGIPQVDALKEDLLARPVDREQPDGPTLSRKTINNILGHLHNLLRLASEHGRTRGVPPARLYRLPPPQDSDYRWLQRDESDRLVNACSGRLRAMVVVGLHTGLRMGELEAIRWEDIAAEGLHVRRSYCQRSREFVLPKSGRQRLVPINGTARAALDQHPRHLRSDLVFCTAAGLVVDKPDLAKQLRAACVRAGLEPIGWHVLRHTFASWLVSAGVDLYAVQKLMGHSTIAMTQRYSHLAPRCRQVAVEVIG
jgi:excisionase family DNA binding protein